MFVCTRLVGRSTCRLEAVPFSNIIFLKNKTKHSEIHFKPTGNYFMTFGEQRCNLLYILLPFACVLV